MNKLFAIATVLVCVAQASAQVSYNNTKALTNNTQVDYLSCDVQPDTTTSVRIDFEVISTDGTARQTKAGSAWVQCDNLGGTVVVYGQTLGSQDLVGNNRPAPPASTFTINNPMAANPGTNACTLYVTPLSSLTSPTITWRYDYHVIGGQACTPIP